MPDAVRVGIDLRHLILPLFAVGGDGRITDFLGTSFLAARGLLVTCWHCLEPAAIAGLPIVAVKQVGERPTLRFQPFPLSDVAQDVNGSDLATAAVNLELDPGGFALKLGEPVLGGTDVCTFGYPLTERPTVDRPKYVLADRYLQGYVTRAFYFPSPRYGEVPSYELDMRAPAGLSGAPLIRRGAGELVGVVYGEHDVARIEESASVDLETGARSPQVERIVSFALAHYTPTVAALKGPATGGRPLAEVMATQPSA